MYLYHYSKDRYPILLTKKKQQILTEEEIEDEEAATKFREDIGSYYESIHFFFDPIPSSIIGDLFKNDHHIWFNGNQIYEYIVDTKDLDKDIKYKIVESPAAIRFLNERGWKEDDNFKKKFFIDMKSLLLSLGEIGYTKKDLEKQCKIFFGKTKKYFIEAVKRPDFQKNRKLYAASVPHVALYPKSGEIPYRHLDLITIGSSKKISLETNLKSLFKNW